MKTFQISSKLQFQAAEVYRLRHDSSPAAAVLRAELAIDVAMTLHELLNRDDNPVVRIWSVPRTPKEYSWLEITKAIDGTFWSRNVQAGTHFVFGSWNVRLDSTIPPGFREELRELRYLGKHDFIPDPVPWP